MILAEPIKGMLKSSKPLILDITNSPSNIPADENIKLFFDKMHEDGLDPKLPINRQQFNDDLIKSSGYKYLIGTYGEDRHSMLDGSRIAKEGRTIHLGIDIFATDLESVLAPCDGEIISTGKEPGADSFGYYLILKPTAQDDIYIFLGHLSKDLPALRKVGIGEKIASLGDYIDDENGGWSRHLHLQMMTKLPLEGEAPIGYSTKEDFETNSQKFPNPSSYFKNWHPRAVKYNNNSKS